MPESLLLQIDELIARFIDGNEAYRSSPVQLAYTDTGNMDAEQFLQSASLAPPKGSTVHPVIDGAKSGVFLGLATVVRDGERASIFPHVAAAGDVPDAAIQCFLDLCTESGKLYQKLPSNVFLQGPSKSPRNMWVARVYGKFRGDTSVCLKASNYEYIPLPFLACVELWKCFRETFLKSRHTATESHAVQSNATKDKARVKASKLALALGILADNPILPDKEIAEAAGATPEYLSRNKKYQAAKAAIVGVGKADFPRAKKDHGRDTDDY
jgi:hypothetical protein